MVHAKDHSTLVTFRANITDEIVRHQHGQEILADTREATALTVISFLRHLQHNLSLSGVFCVKQSRRIRSARNVIILLSS